MAEQNWQKVEEWMELYADRILRMVCLVVGNPHLAEEITQEVFIKAFENSANFRSESAPYTWLYRIALNLSRNYLKRRHLLQFWPWGEEENRLNVLEEPLEEQVTRREAGRKIRYCISRLPLHYREVIILYYYDDLKISDIAKVLEQPEGTVKSHLARGREALEKVMRKEGLTYAREGQI
ncbi:MAG: sigma-70 family RNA polymerase sigma factor [Peptococcaceae bacterium]|nr:sigma-70 family RNA polymerase sigma factor [Peptococcaceae bacterium]